LELNEPVEVAVKSLGKVQASGTLAKAGDDKTFASALSGKASAEFLGASANLNEKMAKLTKFTLVNAKAEGTVAHAQVDADGLVAALVAVRLQCSPQTIHVKRSDVRRLTETVHVTT
jgi:hypothetical protein